MTERTAYLACLIVLAALVFFLPERWTTGARLTLLGVLRPLRESVGPKGGPAPEPAESLDQVRAERDEVRIQNAALAAENSDLKRRLRDLEEFKDAGLADIPKVMLADVLLSRDSSAWRRSLLLARGSADGVTVGAVVVRGKRVVGRIVEVSERSSRVLLLTDPAFVVGAIAVPPNPSKDGEPQREEGILRGSSEDDATLTLSRLSRRTGVQPGWLVITSKDPESRWPAGLLLGTVKSVGDLGNYYLRIEVTPAVDPQGLEYVMILGR